MLKVQAEFFVLPFARSLLILVNSEIVLGMYLSKQYTTNSLPEIGRKFSNRDHTTVIHAVKKIDELIKKDNEIRQNIIEIKKKLL